MSNIELYNNQQSIATVDSIQGVQAVAVATKEIEAAIIVAKRFPRDEMQSYARLCKACERLGFAEDATYSYPRGSTNVSGPSIYFAREAAKFWGNLRYGFSVVDQNDQTITLEGFAWDVESNVKVSSQATFKKMVQRKRSGKTEWVEPDERDLRELINKQGALLVRNCILQLIPSDIIDDAINQAKKTVSANIEKDPKATTKTIVKSFADIGVSSPDLTKILGHGIDSASPKELQNLREIYKSIKDGVTNITDHFPKAETATQENLQALKEKLIPQEQPAQSIEPANSFRLIPE